MKPQIKNLLLVALSATVVVACSPISDIEGFDKSESGLHYKFDVSNPNNPQVQMDDALVCELTLWLENDTLFSNTGDPQRLMSAQDGLFYGSVEEGLLMMHTGDDATFAIEADSIAKYHDMPQCYVAGQGQKLYYHIKLHDIVTADSIAHAESMFINDMETRRQQEPALLAQYLEQNNIKATPNDDGLYVIIRKQGKGTKATIGSQVTFNYTGSLIDGTVFDSNMEEKAREAGIYNASSQYSPQTVELGATSLMQGLRMGLEGLSEGAQATLIIPSALGYKSEWRGNIIKPYSTLVFDTNVLKVQ